MRRYWIALSVVTLLASCATLPERKVVRDDPLVRALRHEVISSLRGRNDAIRSLRGFADVRYGSSVFGARGETAFAIQKPYRLRIDGLSDFGLYNSQLVLAHGDLVILWPAENSYYRGLATPEAMHRYLLVNLRPEVAIEILLGVVPLEDEEDYGVRKIRKGEGIFLMGRRGEMTVELREGAYLPVQYTAYDVDGSNQYRLHYSDYRREGDVWFAGRLQAKFTSPRSRIEILYKEVEINPAIDKTLFEIKIPDGAKEIKD